jgi:hypothetical protein
MKEEAFRELVISVKQAGRIRRGTLKASRTTVFRPADVRGCRRARRLEESKGSVADKSLIAHARKTP